MVRWALRLALAALFVPHMARADGHLLPPDTVETVGQFGPATECQARSPRSCVPPVTFVSYKGIFEGVTSTGAYRVPYEIVAPSAPGKGNRTVLIEPPHVCGGEGLRELFFGDEYIFGRGFSYGAVGYALSNCFGGPLGSDNGILRPCIVKNPETGEDEAVEPSQCGLYIDGGVRYYTDIAPAFFGENQTDDEIIRDFAVALVRDPVARSILGAVERRYVSGFSQSSEPIVRMIDNGLADGVFDFAFPMVISSGSIDIPDPQLGIEDGLFGGKVISVGSEGDWPIGVLPPDGDGLVLGPGGLEARSDTEPQYRRYEIASAPHASDTLVPGFFANHSTPVDWGPAARAFFLAGDRWVVEGTPPRPSTHFKDDCAGEPFGRCRDDNGNILTVDAEGHRVPRDPVVELGEAHFDQTPIFLPGAQVEGSSFIGDFDGARSVGDPGFYPTFDAYREAFTAALRRYVDAGFMIAAETRSTRFGDIAGGMSHGDDSELVEDAARALARATLCPPYTFTQNYWDRYDAFVAMTPCP